MVVKSLWPILVVSVFVDVLGAAVGIIVVGVVVDVVVGVVVVVDVDVVVIVANYDK